MKYKYYFRKPKSEIAKDILKLLVTTGFISIAVSSPYFVLNLMKNFKRWQKYKKETFYSAFWRLKKQGYICIEKRNHEISISLTKEGKKIAGWLQIDALKIKKIKKWDRKWRIVIFDICQLKAIYRNLFRSKLKELGFYRLQDSVWIHPFECRDEIELLRDFFGFSHKEMRLVVAQEIGHNDYLKKVFKV